ncbi:MAG: hypothetical protein B6242_14525 [Anaerolineaceae bacterium 4572_78]|nr:MAG: hypothetical protein B6242_14525 [Anaerolineaceae bacterium 4572_78]
MAKVNKSNVLLVEGNDDKHVIIHFLKRYLNIEKVEALANIRDVGGKSNLFNEKFLGEELKSFKLQRLGIVIDSDELNPVENISANWVKLRDLMKRLGMNPPDIPNSNGVIFKFKSEYDTVIKVGIWVMPNNESVGAIENFLLELIPHDDEFIEHVKTCLEHVEPHAKTNRRTWLPKAQMRTWLAWQKEPGKVIS